MMCGADNIDGIETRVFLDIDSLLRPVYGHAKGWAARQPDGC